MAALPDHVQPGHLASDGSRPTGRRSILYPHHQLPRLRKVDEGGLIAANRARPSAACSELNDMSTISSPSSCLVIPDAFDQVRTCWRNQIRQGTKPDEVVPARGA